MVKKAVSASRFILPLYMNKLKGRMLLLPSEDSGKRSEILVVYGQKSTIEKWLPLCKVLSIYGNVTMPDMPGFGGMDSFYKIHEKPTISNYSDYLAAFIKLRYKRKKINIVGLSFGFVVVTRMLQDYPELAKKVNLVFCVSGLAHSDDIDLDNFDLYRNRAFTNILSRNLPASIYKKAIYHPQIVKLANYLGKTKDYHLEQLKLASRRRNDIRTEMFTSNQLLKLDNCQKQVDLTVYNIISDIHGNMLDNAKLEQHLQIIFSKYKAYKLKKTTISNNYELTEEDISAALPKRLVNFLTKLI